jgi:NADH-quinone oxidoreductase subunit C
MSEEPKGPQPPTPPAAAADKPAGATPAEPLKGEVSRTDAPGAGASAAPVAAPRAESPAPNPAAPPAAKPVAPAAAKPAAPAAAKPAAPHVPPPPPAPTGPTDPPPPADKALPGFITSLQAQTPGGVTKISFYLGDWTIIVPVAKLIEVARHLRDSADARFDYLSDLTATDWPPRKEGRFDVVYMLYSTVHRHRVRMKVVVAEDQPIASATAVWPAANWLEREVYDMFGVNFTGHPDRRRILMPEDWQGYPQRKDYPLEGPGELLMENPIDWLKLRQAKEEAEIE